MLFRILMIIEVVKTFGRHSKNNIKVGKCKESGHLNKLDS